MKSTYAVLLVLAALTACKKAASENLSRGSGGAGSGGGAPPPLPVEAAVARTDTVVDAILSTGQIEAVQSIELRPDIEGRVVAIYAREGREVVERAPLFKIDDAELKAEVARAEAQRDLARQALDRTRGLLTQKASSQAELERTEATARSTEAQLELLKVRLDRTTVRAPFSGVVGQRFASLGDYVTTSSRLAAMQTVSPMRASFSVPERYADQLKLRQRVTFQVAALPGKEFTGVVDFVDPVVQLPGRTINVKAQVPNPRRELSTGMFIEARLATAVRPNAVVIPEDAVVPLQGVTFVWVAANGKAVRREVALGVRSPGFVEAKRGVDAGEQVVVGGQERLADGAPVAVKLVDRTPAASKEGASRSGSQETTPPSRGTS